MKNINERLESILEKIGYIEQIVQKSSSVTNALSDKTTSCPAILMHLIAIAEQIAKISTEDNAKASEIFGNETIKGFCDVRNFIAHDYDGVSMAVIEWLLRYGLDNLKTRVTTILVSFK